MTEERPEKLSTTDARQGRTGLGVRYVLIIGLIAVVVAFAAIYLNFLHI